MTTIIHGCEKVEASVYQLTEKDGGTWYSVFRLYDGAGGEIDFFTLNVATRIQAIRDARAVIEKMRTVLDDAVVPDPIETP